MKIRKAALKDIKTVLKFQNLLNKYESKFAKFKINKNKTLKALKDKNVAYFIAYSKEPVGCAEVYLKGNSAIMSGTFILPKFREKGFAKALFKARKSWAKNNKVKELKLKVYNKNKRAILVWNKLGYKTQSKGKLITMVYKL